MSCWDLVLLTGRSLCGFNIRDWCKFLLCHGFDLFLKFTFPVLLVYFVRDGLKPCTVIPTVSQGMCE